MASRRLKLLGESKRGISLEGRNQTIVKVEGFKGIFLLLFLAFPNSYQFSTHFTHLCLSMLIFLAERKCLWSVLHILVGHLFCMRCLLFLWYVLQLHTQGNLSSPKGLDRGSSRPLTATRSLFKLFVRANIVVEWNPL